MTAAKYDPWSLSIGLLKTFVDFQETIWNVPRVVAARTPTLIDAWRNPLGADRRELGRMVTEKVGALGQSSRTLSRHGAAVSAGLRGNAHDMGRLAGGDWLGFSDWCRIAERNLSVTSAMIRLPGELLAPIHKGVTANARRLG